MNKTKIADSLSYKVFSTISLFQTFDQSFFFKIEWIFIVMHFPHFCLEASI